MRVNVCAELEVPVVWVMAPILPDVSDERAMWLGAAIAVVASLLLTTLAAALESSINGPGSRTVAAPVLWAFGGGAGLALGAVVASWISRRAWPGIFAAVVGALPYLVLVVLGYNSSDLRAEDQIVGSLLIVVLPGVLVAMLLASVTAMVARAVGGRRGTGPEPAAG
jgi:peptidoglycan/LPS O-acetylase OafA/YrhL